MPWSNQSGGGNGGGGPWGQRGGSGGGGPWGGGSGGGNGNPPDLEEILRRSQDRLKNLMPGGGLGGRGIVLGALLLVALWLLSGTYFVRPNEVGLNLVFGKFTGKTGEGMNWNWPYPVGNVVKPQVTNVITTEVGFRTVESVRQSRQTDVTEESLMLTGDENIVDIDFIVQWQIDPAAPENYVFNIQDPPGTVKAVAESAMREIIGKRNIQPVLTTDRGAIDIKKGGGAVPYHEEDPHLRQEFEATLAADGAVSRMEQRFYDGPLILSGAIAHGASILAAQALGADLAYMGTRFIATREANATDAYKQALVDSAGLDIVYTPYFTGIPGNYLKASIAAAGLDPANLPQPESGASNFGSTRVKPWKDIWGAGQGVGGIASVLPTRQIVDALRTEYADAKARLDGRSFA